MNHKDTKDTLVHKVKKKEEGTHHYFELSQCVKSLLNQNFSFKRIQKKINYKEKKEIVIICNIKMINIKVIDAI
ncbi:hypothetical protein CAL7716_012760 [Calothrix sp. PCC 7716]|nr:hypothetical protein CAL7716_012760 [Calothrix sp. PCC 7716]